MKDNFCQSCGMPMGTTNEFYGTNTDGNKNSDYCLYCYDNGHFKCDCSMNEMIDICIPHMLREHPTMTKEQAQEMMNSFLPALKRWHK